MMSLLRIAVILFALSSELLAQANESLRFRAEEGSAAVDPGYRVIVSAKTSVNSPIPFPQASSDWELHYRFVVPPLPATATWNYRSQVFYLWGDVDFDSYSVNGSYPLSNYTFNQIVPQLMTGYSFAKNDASFHPSSIAYKDWVIQAQYYWANGSADFAQAGEVIHVKPGDRISTSIRYTASTGEIIVGISSPEGTSSIVIPRPFPNEAKPLFSSWKDYFEQAAAKSSHLLGRPLVNVESHLVDQATLCSILPFSVREISWPGIPSKSENYEITHEGTFACDSPLAELRFK
jgi:hypothetical protein